MELPDGGGTGVELLDGGGTGVELPDGVAAVEPVRAAVAAGARGSEASGAVGGSGDASFGGSCVDGGRDGSGSEGDVRAGASASSSGGRRLDGSDRERRGAEGVDDRSMAGAQQVCRECPYPRMSLEACLWAFVREEELRGDNAWGCEGCTRRTVEEVEGRGRQEEEERGGCSAAGHEKIEEENKRCLRASGVSAEREAGHTGGGALEGADVEEREGGGEINQVDLVGEKGGTFKGIPGCKEGRKKEISKKPANSKVKVKTVRSPAVKRYLIYQPPAILTVHLKRFKQDMRGRLSKIGGHISFPVTLDLQPFMQAKGEAEGCSGRCNGGGRESDSKAATHPGGQRAVALLARDGEAPQAGGGGGSVVEGARRRHGVRYRLVGVVEHSGTMRGGHYVAFVARRAEPPPAPALARPPSFPLGSESATAGGSCDGGAAVRWFCISDSAVREVAAEQVMRCEAYLLFFQRCC